MGMSARRNRGMGARLLGVIICGVVSDALAKNPATEVGSLAPHAVSEVAKDAACGCDEYIDGLNPADALIVCAKSEPGLGIVCSAPEEGKSCHSGSSLCTYPYIAAFEPPLVARTTC